MMRVGRHGLREAVTAPSLELFKTRLEGFEQPEVVKDVPVCGKKDGLKRFWSIVFKNSFQPKPFYDIVNISS